MKEGFDKEIDSLLRRRAATRVHSFDDGVSAPRDEAHLDADELSAFAEGALPTAARVAAVSHLADCDECRGLAVNLVRASGTEAELEKRAVAASTPASASKPVSRGWLSSIFAPRVLRYLAPALVVCLVAVVSFVALRTRRGSEQLAQRAARSEKAPIGITQEQTSGEANMTANANTDGLTSATSESATRSTGTANTLAPGAGKGHGDAGEAAPSAPTDAKKDESPAPPPPSKAGEAPAETAATTSRPAKDEPREAAKTETKEKAGRVAGSEEEVAAEQQPQQVAKRGNQSRGVEVQMPDGSRNQKRGVVDNAPNSAGGSLSSSAPREDRDNSRAAAGAPATRRARPSNEARAKSEDDEGTRAEETRAAGHRFRRDGGAWVDVNFKTSMRQTGVRRGTEAFRALVADIPELGRVAEQLSGEVVVVVKGHAYRIR